MRKNYKSSKPSGGQFCKIVFEDEDLLVIDKPAGLLSSTVPREKRATAIAAATQYLAESDPDAKIGLIHRLDKDVSGLMVFSKNNRAFDDLKSQFYHHSAGRIYWAIVTPPPKLAKGKIESHLVEWKDGSVHSTRAPGRGQRAITEYEMLGKKNKIALVRVKLHTGRKHQIRAHLSERGSPVIGDEMYKGKPDPAGMMLAAVELRITHPRDHGEMVFKIDLPDRLSELLENIGLPWRELEKS